MYDIVIRNGSIIDGSGFPAYRADLGIIQGRIASIGRINDRGREEIDAEGHVVTPGFIDGHTHMDAQVFWDPLGSCSCFHGITTVVMGHCGFTIAPVNADQRELVVRNLERAEDMSPDALRAGINWSWTSFAGYLDAVDALPKGINYVANVGHSALRTWAMGERAFEQTATEEDIRRMDAELKQALQAGAFGFTTSRTPAHQTSDNRPVASRLADWNELQQLVGTVGAQGGMFQLVNEPASMSPDAQVRDEYYERLGNLLVSSGVPAGIPLIAGSFSRELMQRMDQWAQSGARPFGLSHSRGISVLLTFKTRLPYDSLPEWAEVRSKPLEEQRMLLSDPEIRKRLVAAAHNGNYGRAVGTEARKPDYNLMCVLEKPLPPHRTVLEAARERNMDPVEYLIDVSVRSNFEQFFIQPLRYYDERELVELMKYPRGVMTFSDAGAHVSQIFDFSIQTHLLAYWVRERQTFSLEEAVRMLTFAPARAWNLSDRGLIREGMAADINVFDPAALNCTMPAIAADLPAGAKRIVQKSIGIRATIVGGKVFLKDGEHTGNLAGKLLRRTRSKS